MKIIDANTIEQKKMETDVCIVGSGPAGIALALKLKSSDLDIVIAESGGVKNSDRANELNSLEIQSNFTYRNDESNRNRQLGGTANLWAGRIVPFSFDDSLDEEWSGLKEKVIPFFDDAFRIFGIDPEIQNKHPKDDGEFYAYWADKTQRFNAKSGLLDRNSRVQIYYNLSCIGEPVFENQKIHRMGFLNGKGENIQIKATCFVFAMGAIENSKMLLIIRETIRDGQNKQMENVGKYLMDHPRIWHGSISRNSDKSAISKYQIRRTELGIYKTGIRNHPHTNRVYSNLMRSRGYLNSLMDYIPSETFKYSLWKLLMRERGIVRGFTNEMLKWPLIRHSKNLNRSLKIFFNHVGSESFHLMTYCEQRPKEENKIILKAEKNRNGLRVPKLVNNIQESELQEVADFFKYLKGYLHKLDCQLNYSPEYINNPGHYTDAAHPMGGTRYSCHQNRRVVDMDLSVAGIPNLYISGSSVFPTGSVENPTHLIVSLSCYLAEVISQKYR